MAGLCTVALAAYGRAGVVAALAEAVKSSDAALQEHALRALAGLVNLVNNHHVNSLLPLQQGLYLI
jgi:hypothetical protein